MYSASLQGLRVFCAVVREGSFKSAAARMFVSPSAVSHRIKTLEEQFGNLLFERNARSINLTRFGETVFSKIDPLINEIDKQITDLVDIADAESIKITLPPFFSTQGFLPRLQEFTVNNKNTVITLDTHDQHPTEHPEDSDLSILLSDVEPKSPCVAKLLSLILVPVCAPKLQFSQSDFNPEKLKDMTLLIHAAREKAWNQWYKKYSKAELPPRKIIILDSMIEVVRAAEQGLGYALVPQLLISKWTDAGSLVAYSDYNLPTDDSYYLVTDSKNLNRPQVAKLTKWVLETFQ